MTKKRRTVRTSFADGMGFAWDPDELVDMDLEDAREIVRLDEEAQADGAIGNEDTVTIAHARQLIAATAGPFPQKPSPTPAI
ncbi:hypothetical protein [Muricoccus vinaceus]|uniref:Uncharacterized protein n=1 Tax=Muricoccus vinaceus TaxID=424704 RepID=A0ABV6J340_9PROT